MATTLTSTGITFPDATTQTTAAGAPTTAQVLSATAGASVNQVGTYCFLGAPSPTSFTADSTYSGSNVRYSGILAAGTYTDNTAGAISGTSPGAGTWRAMGSANNTSRYAITLFLRIA